MPGLYEDEAVVLRSIKLGEADRILTLYTRDNGKVRAVAKGVRKTKSRFGGRLEPYTRIEMLLYRGRGDLDTITGADVVEANVALRRDYTALASAAVMAEVIERITPDREASHQNYSLLTSALAALGRGPGSVLPAFLLKLLSVSGYHPHLKACAGCGGAAVLGGFSAAFGGAICEDCWSQDQNAIGLSAERIATMADLLARDFGIEVDGSTIDEVTDVLRRYAEYHLERPLRTFQLLRPISA